MEKAFDLKAMFGTDKRAEIEGRDVALSATFSVRIARAQNRRHMEKLQTLMKQYRVQLQTNTLPADVLEAVSIQAMAGTILVHWTGTATLGKSEIGPYSDAEAVRVMTELPDFREFVAKQARDIDLFREESEVEADKNLSPTPDGEPS